ncbi:hypothetical protein [Paenibacillus sp. FSL L8-0494]|uniref:hypothetical protein n=1 Tax=Paenibacillus sp. FSL L8-0494 TaxID=2975352 RepID=UPI0030F6F598
MAIQVELSDDIFTQDEVGKLKKLFGTETDESFIDAINAITAAAITEYKEMLLGKGLATRADEIKQHRLFHLVKHYFQGRIPTESEVSLMFQLTESESRALIRNVRTKFRYQLEEEVFSTLKLIVSSAVLSGSNYFVVIQSDNVLEELNRVISLNAPQLDPITKARGSARQYQISEDTYDLLRGYYHIGQGATG